MKATLVQGILAGGKNADGSDWTGGEEVFRKDLAPGSFDFAEGTDGQIASIQFVCPCGCGSVGSLPVRRGFSSSIWHWDGNKEAPTLTPSVLRTSGCKWHGYLTKGEWKQA